MSNLTPYKVLRYCGRCGSKSFEKNKENSLLCNDCGFEFFINISGAVAAIIKDSENRVLLTIRKNNPAANMLDVPGGFVNTNETAEHALKREIKEELNLDICKSEYYKAFVNEYEYKGILYYTLDLVYFCTVKDLKNIKAADDVLG